METWAETSSPSRIGRDVQEWFAPIAEEDTSLIWEIIPIGVTIVAKCLRIIQNDTIMFLFNGDRYAFLGDILYVSKETSKHGILQS
jgi:hypothetical protein